LTEANLEEVIADMEGSVISSRHGSQHGSERRGRPSSHVPGADRELYYEDEFSKPDLERRYTELPPYASELSRRPEFPPPARAMSVPNMADDNIDMNLAYGDLPPPLPSAEEEQQELTGLMSKLDILMLEAQCIQHSATTIIASLQQNPDAMAAVALTLAEISKIITKIGPSILTSIKLSSPAIFALLASPQFLIAGGVAVGVTIVMFGGYKIIKKIQSDAAERKEAPRMLEEPMAFDGELSSIEIWRRGIAEVEAQSVATSVDGEFISPAAARLQEDRIRDRAREERVDEEVEETRSAITASSRATSRATSKAAPRAASRAASQAPSVADSSHTRSTSRRKDVSRKAYAETVATESTIKTKKETREKKTKKPSALVLMFKKKTESKGDRAMVKGSRHHHHHPRMIEV